MAVTRPPRVEERGACERGAARRMPVATPPSCRPPPPILVALAVVILVTFLASPSRAVNRVHTVFEPAHRTLQDQSCLTYGCPPPPPPPTEAQSPPTSEAQPKVTQEAAAPFRSFVPARYAASPPPASRSPSPSPSPPRPPPPAPALTGCEATGECSVESLVRRHAVDNTVVVTFGNMKQAHFTENWVYHLRKLGVGGLLVGMMNMRFDQPRYVRLAAKLRPLGVGVYTVNSPEVRRQPQGGRWFHVLPLLRTGARVLLSDSDVVWLRDPRPYLQAVELLHPKLDFTVSSDAQGGSDGRRLPTTDVASSRRRRARGMESGSEEADLDLEAFGHCWTSMNIGIMHFPPGARPGTLAAMEQAVAHLSEENNLGRVDQGPINYRWKHGAGKWRWKRQLHAVRDVTGSRLCGMLNGTSVGGVLPSAQFCNTLTHSVLQLWKAQSVRPFVVHATWMRTQAEPYKRMRLREESVWRDEATWYGAGPRGNTRHTTSLGPIDPPAGLMVYEPDLRPEWLEIRPMSYKGGIPIHHLVLMHEQLRQLRNALFIARALGRALVLPHTICTCEMGFFPYHVQTSCKASDHPTLQLPSNCSLDHYLDPPNLEKSPYKHRERSFLTNPRTPIHLLRASAVRVRVCASGASSSAGECTRTHSRSLLGFAGGGEVRLPPKPTIGQLRSQLENHASRVLVFDDVLASFGGWGASDDARELSRFHEDAQALLSSWCCTDDPRFKRLAGVIPYVLPPLEGQSIWRGHARLTWAASALAEVFDAANQSARAREIRPLP